ncbi:hypothetical protein ABDD95_04740 [Mucilaginibacter sp. PAMB04274]|uniref:hypothetical protein n=1 Tax=Mucilaginibacter sp. PAMB04274 TaxID=3138568 RepID=UPI0031F67DC7
MIAPPEPPKRTSDGKILGYNLLVFAGYTVLAILANPKEGAFVAFFISIAHFVVAIIAALVAQRWIWLLAGALVLIIGFGTCVSNFTMGDMR